MKSYVPDFNFETPSSLDEAFKFINQGYKPFAGGTDIMVLYETGNLNTTNFVSLETIDELKSITYDNDFLYIGALSTFREIAKNTIIKNEFPLLHLAAKEVGALAIQNRATIGGNIVNASPGADSPPSLLCYDAIIEIISDKKQREIDYHNFHTGYKITALKQDELLSKIILKRNTNNFKCFYRKVGTRNAQSISKVSFAVNYLFNDNILKDIKLAMGSVNETPIRIMSVESILKNKTITPEIIDFACSELQKTISPIDDIRSTAKYRKKVSSNLLRFFLETFN